MKRSCLTPWQSIKIYFGENFFCSYLAKKKKKANCSQLHLKLKWHNKSLYLVPFYMVCKVSCITQITVCKLHVNTHINNLIERDNSKSAPVWMVKTDNVADRTPQNVMPFTEALTRHWHCSNNSPTSHSPFISGKKEHFNLSITDAAFLPVSNGVVVPPWNSFVGPGVKYYIRNLEPWKKCYIWNWLYS